MSNPDVTSQDPVQKAAAFAADYDFELRNIKAQLKAFDKRTNKKVEALRDFNEFFVKQAEIEMQYGKQLDALRARFNKPRNERGAVANVTKALRRPSTFDQEEEDPTIDSSITGILPDVWNVLLEQTQKRAESRQRFASNLMEEMRQRLEVLEKETMAVHKKCNELGVNLQGELKRRYMAVDENLKNYQNTAGKYNKAEESLDKARGKGQLKKGEKLKDKTMQANRKVILASNEYALSLNIANALKGRYYKREVASLFDTMDLHFHDGVKYVFQLYRDLSMQSEAVNNKAISNIYSAADRLSPQVEKEVFFKEEHPVIFVEPSPFDFVFFRKDEVPSIVSNEDTNPDLVAKYAETESKLKKLDDQIQAEKTTLATISQIRQETGQKIQHRPDGSVKSVENSVMYADAYGRLSLKQCLRACLAAQLDSLGTALGEQRPSATATSDVINSDEQDNPMPTPKPESVALAEAQRSEFRRKSMSSAMRKLQTRGTATSMDGNDSDNSSFRSRTGSIQSGLSEGLETQSLQPVPTSPTRVVESDTQSLAPSTTSTAKSPKLRRKAPLAPPGPVARVGTKRGPKKPERPPDPGQGVGTGVGVAGRRRGKPAPAAKPPRPPPVAAGADQIKEQEQYKFGGNLEAIMASGDGKLPVVVGSCIACLRKHSLQDEGLFRVPGSGSQIDELKAAFELGKDPLADGIPADVQSDAIAGLLKLYLRGLEVPVMTEVHYSTLVQIGNMQDRNPQLQALRAAMERLLPNAHVTLLAKLMLLLHHVAQNSNVNMMDSSNLALVFGPTLMPAPKDDMGAMLRDAAPINTLMCAMIDNVKYIFAKFLSEEDLAADAMPPPPPPEAEEPSPPTPVDTLEEAPIPDADVLATSAAMEEKKKAIALHDYTARTENELSFRKGQTLFVFGQADGNWYTGEADGQQGFVAAAYVKVEESDDFESVGHTGADVLTPEPDYDIELPPEPTTPSLVVTAPVDDLPPAPLPADDLDDSMTGMGFPPPTPPGALGHKAHLRRGSNTSNFSRTSSFGPSFAPPLPPQDSTESFGELPTPPSDFDADLPPAPAPDLDDDSLFLPPPELPPMPEEDEAEA
eukprot:TRINITY_DN9794_c0_g1_i1.p1 TRINITY_DN9794_c0_g1~~TRINITY_DN9794_c0_g1_i1.p1  ORF type:complete len:1088 (+),score=284.97 TRINITY_DN9794_c0_g1_i1:1627-4890(+)